MRASTREKGVLKLVHPGKHVEIHKQPITAAEVMSKKPRHSVARPDVFEYPWVVVRPESVLVPGEVFYIVPNRTIHKLLKSKSKVQSSKDYQRNISLPKDILPQNSCAGMTPKHQISGEDMPRQHEENGEEKGSNTPRREVIFKNKRVSKLPVDSLLVSSVKCNRTMFPESQNVDKKIKSCMRKKGDLRKSRYLRVRFELSSMVTSEMEHNVVKRKGFAESLWDNFSIGLSLCD